MMSADHCEEGKGAWVDEGWGDVQVSMQHPAGNCAQTACPTTRVDRHTPRREDGSPGEPQVLISSSIKVKVRGYRGAPTVLCNTVHISEIPPNLGRIYQFAQILLLAKSDLNKHGGKRNMRLYIFFIYLFSSNTYLC